MIFVSFNALAAFYEDPVNVNNEACINSVSKMTEAMQMQDILNRSVINNNAEPSPELLGTYYEIYSDMFAGSKGILSSCDLSQEEAIRFVELGRFAADKKSDISSTLGK